MAVIDADAHVIETERTWEFVDPAMERYKPMIVRRVDGHDPEKEFWVIDGQLRAKGHGNVSYTTPKESRELLDVQARLRHMDELGVDIQVLYPSMLQWLTDNPEVEAAMWRSYNRWMAEVWAQGEGRLRWVCRLPLGTMEDAVTELRFAKAHGACGIFLRSVEGDRLPCNPYFFPLYEEASALDVPICVHASLANRTMLDLFSQDGDNGNFMKFKVSVFSVCHSLVMSNVPASFPRLRFGFIETSAQWVPYVANEIAKRFAWKGRGANPAERILRDNHMYVACEITDDMPYVLKYAGEDNLVMGTDYGHADTSAELMALQELRARTDIPPGVADRILDENARALYGL